MGEIRQIQVEGTVAVEAFVHLPYWLDVPIWQTKYEAGLVPDQVPYGYHHAEKEGFTLFFSRSHGETRFTSLIRRIITRCLGFDIVHAWRNRHQMLDADVVWTHTEVEHLAVAMLLLVVPRSRRPKLIAQSIWLLDKWPLFSMVRRRFYRFLMEQADIQTVHSPENLAILRSLVPRIRSEAILFGISLDSFPIESVRSRHPAGPLRVLSLGNDIHRDWPTLLKALVGKEKMELRILTSRIAPESIGNAPNVQIIRPCSLQEVKAEYRWADFVVVTLKPNLHASGITVILEAIAMGVPVICTDTGGLRAYFSSNEVCYVPAGDAPLLADALLRLAADPQECSSMAKRAQGRLKEAALTSEGYAVRHCQISRRLLAETP